MPGGYLRDNLWIRSMPSDYSPAQITAYLERIGWDTQATPSEQGIQTARFPRSVETLGRVVLGHLKAFPWDNTGMHYTEDHRMDVTPHGAFNTLMYEARGSYCFGENTVLLHILRGLGFRAYSGQARVNRNWAHPGAPPAHASHTHMVIFVQPDDSSNETYVVDVGFGSGGLVRPIPLVQGDESITQGIGPAEWHRLDKKPMPGSALATSLDESSQPGQDLWALHIYTGKREDLAGQGEGQWRQMYAFSELEFFPVDAVDGSFVVEKSTEGFFAMNICAVKVFSEEASASQESGGCLSSPRLYRKVLFGNEVKKYSGDGQVEVLRTFNTERERLEALREVFGVRYGDNAAQYITGRAPAFAQGS
ncbi:cysteine proteinase [Coprinellus micaceus]|uniref:Cysteine proteinase n=1 Tax=Coprinellus micaceus TaxID=71717 RepID=A0A4Y7T9U9_COPMI|nr:cysteine proteinase [Coprinellus micaceus]